jgi:hypothetical protein
MEYLGVKCKKVLPIAERNPELYAVVPLVALHRLGVNSDKAKMLVLLYAYGRMNAGKWFPLSGVVLERYGIQQRQKRRILKSFEEAGLLKLKIEPGKAMRIKLIKRKAR